ncbi:uncharacterized protein LOC100207983 precursor [Hydra vulgaris]|uniref:Nematocyst outer wall antigen n=1 Tax=Hydra vulgaris TaxID=6087 RepID=Q8IT70_HYDVU|nr:uncharacterized protein LOC100207983 precursor [Hydra vulgaris]AAN52336.1 nematocyst outer wall antigen precursor [Hydra vulgaris]
MRSSTVWLFLALLSVALSTEVKDLDAVDEQSTKRDVPTVAVGVPPTLDDEGKLTNVTMKKLLSETNRYRLMHGVTPLGSCPVCSEAAQKHADEIAASGVAKPDHNSKYGQIIFSSKDPEDINQGADYFGTLVPARIYNQIKNFDFVKDAFKENAADFSQLVWEGSEVVGFASKKAGDTVYVVMYFNPAGNNESLSFYDNVHRVTGSGDMQQKIKCPDGWKANNGNCYKLFEEEMAWADAVDHCNVLKSSLFSGESVEEGAFLKTMLVGRSSPSWIGMSDMAAKGGFQFVDGTPYVYSDWSRESQQLVIDLWNTKKETVKNQCITASYEGWNYKDCFKKLPFVCKMRPNGMTSYSLDLYFPGSSFTDDLYDINSQRYATMKGVITKAFNESYGKDIWFVGSTFYQFMSRENGDVAASTLLRFAPDVRAPVDPITKLRDYLRGQTDLKILSVRLIPGSGRGLLPNQITGTCPSGCSGDCYPECKPGCCGQVNLNAPVQPSGYTACSQYPNCGLSCQSSCSQSCCQQNPYQPSVMSGTIVIQPNEQSVCPQHPGCSQHCAPRCSPQCCQQSMNSLYQPPQMSACPQFPSCSPTCAPQCSQLCCQQSSMPLQMPQMPSCPQFPSCSASCAPQCSQQCCQQPSMSIQPLQISSCPQFPSCSPSCAPQCSQQCCQQPSMPIQLPLMGSCSQMPGCSASCAPLCSQQCCQQQSMLQQSIMQQPMMMAQNPCSLQQPGCSSACAPACRLSCCSLGRMNLGRKRSHVHHKKLKTSRKKKQSKA